MKTRLRALLPTLRFRLMQMSRYFRRCCRFGNRSFLSTIGYMMLLLFIFFMFSTQFSSGKPNNFLSDQQNTRYVPQQVIPRRDDAGQANNQFHADSNLLHKNRQRDGLGKSVAHKHGSSSSNYPLLAPNGKFVPLRRIVHLDLKGGAYKPTFFPKLFDLFNLMNFTGIIIEWEDMFPFTGQLSKAVNGYVYKMDDVRFILQSAKERNLEVIPLVQTLGHLEWVLKLQEFEHLRDDSKSPTVICVGLEGVFELIKDMIDQVARVHREFGMKTFHMGADEAFQFGFCNGTVEQIRKEGSRDKALLWHLARVATHIKKTYSVDIMAWHDMFAHISEDDLFVYDLPNLIQPVLWSYAEDLDMYLPVSTWYALKPFKNVWGASAFKGADGPQQYFSNPLHYIRNHESWVQQFNRVYTEFDRIEGLIYSGWSRYDHSAILCELFPIAIPQLAFCAETMFAAQPLNSNYPNSKRWLGCEATVQKGSFTIGCNFPGSRLYELINDFAGRKERAQNFLDTDYDFNGWLSRATDAYPMSSPTAIDKFLPNLDYHLNGLKFVVEEFQKEASKIYFQETIDEYLLVYMSDIVETLTRKRKLATKLKSTRVFPKRPFISSPKSEL